MNQSRNASKPAKNTMENYTGDCIMQTASQIMAAKREAKKNAQIERRAKQVIGNKRYDRNQKASYQYRQRAFLLGMRDGQPCDKDENVTDEIRNLLHYGTLVYQYDVQSVMVFEKLIRAMRIIAAIYDDQTLKAMCHAAESAIEQIREDSSSPNQRRRILRPLVLLSSMAAQYGDVVPMQTAEQIAKYCAAVQVCLYSTSLYDRPIEHIESLNAVINGKSLRDQAKKYGEKENIMRENILSAAWCLYRIAECFIDVQEPNAIPDLRRSEWLDFGAPEKLQGLIKRITRQWLIPFEQATGLTMIDYNDFRKKLIKIEKQAA